MKTQNETIGFRSINEKDIDELYNLLNNLSWTAKKFFHPHSFDKNTITEICSSKKDHYFVMTVNGVICGYSFLRLFGFTIPSFGCCIRSGYEKRGYGTKLTRWTIQKAKEIGYKKIMLHVYKDNIIALNIYEKSGFTTINENINKNELQMEVNL
jgi:RimJ/RimL family protein N-acetyltransferase